MKRNLIPTALSCVLAVACQGGGGDSKKSNLPGLEVQTEVTGAADDATAADGTKFSVTAERSVKLRDDLANLEAYALGLNTYKISVSASRALVGALLSCKKLTAQNLEEDQATMFSSLSGSATVSFDLYPADYDAVYVNCVVSDATNNELHAFKTVLRKGYVVRGTQNIRSLGATKIDTLVMMEKAELVLGAGDVELSVENFIAKNAEISTFRKADVSQTLPGKHGDSADRLFFTATNAIGEVSFNMRGKDAGIQDKKPQQPKPKPRGANGDCSRGNCDGADGARGDDAVNGFPGLSGGGTGYVVFRIVNESDLIVHFNLEPGKGSEGSAPSEPGLGGEGGRGDVMTIPGGSACPTGTGNEDLKCGDLTSRGRAGRRGANGNPGVAGERGADGKVWDSVLVFEARGQRIDISNSWSTIEGDL